MCGDFVIKNNEISLVIRTIRVLRNIFLQGGYFMSQNKIKTYLTNAINNVSSNIAQFVVNPEKDLTRCKKLPANKLLSFLITEGSSSTVNELLDFFDFSNNHASASALNQQRDKLKSEGVYQVMQDFNQQYFSQLQYSSQSQYRYLAADGSSATFFSNPNFSDESYLVNQGHSQKGFYNVHINAFQDLQKHIYTDVLIQPVHQKDEYKAFCTMVDRHPVLYGTHNVYIGDRGYCSYNNMAHVIESGQYFLFRTKDINSKGLVSNFDYSGSNCFDIKVNVTLVRSHSKKIEIKSDFYRRFIDAAASFDYVEYGSNETYDLSFRIVRFKLSEDSYECLVTNLPENEFDEKQLKLLYFSRWAIESSFRKLKYTIGLSNFHSYKPEFIKQEIYARIIMYNATEAMINETIIEKKNTKHDYKVNFTVAAHICRNFLRLTTEEVFIDVTALLQRELIPVRNDRQYPRLKTAHFRKPRYFIYRAA